MAYFGYSKLLQKQRIALMRPLTIKVAAHHFPLLYDDLQVEQNGAFCAIFAGEFEIFE